MQIPRQQFALKISSSECQGKSFISVICYLLGKVSKCGQATTSRELGWKGRRFQEGSPVPSAGAVTQGISDPPPQDPPGTWAGGDGVHMKDCNGRCGQRVAQASRVSKRVI